MLIKRVAGGAALLLTLHAPVGDDRACAEGVVTADPRTDYQAAKRAGSSDERRRLFGAGVAAARARLATDPDDPAGLLWLAANLGGEALEHGKLYALRVLPEMERLLLRLESRAPLYDHAAAARTLGRLYHKAPALISIGSMKRARAYFERALDRAGDFPPNQVLAADFFADDGDRARACALATRYLAAPVIDDPDADEWRAMAARIVARGPR